MKVLSCWFEKIDDGNVGDRMFGVCDMFEFMISYGLFDKELFDIDMCMVMFMDCKLLMWRILLIIFFFMLLKIRIF